MPYHLQEQCCLNDFLRCVLWRQNCKKQKRRGCVLIAACLASGRSLRVELNSWLILMLFANPMDSYECQKTHWDPEKLAVFPQPHDCLFFCGLYIVMHLTCLNQIPLRKTLCPMQVRTKPVMGYRTPRTRKMVMIWSVFSFLVGLSSFSWWPIVVLLLLLLRLEFFIVRMAQGQ